MGLAAQITPLRKKIILTLGANIREHSISVYSRDNTHVPGQSLHITFKFEECYLVYNKTPYYLKIESLRKTSVLPLIQTGIIRLESLAHINDKKHNYNLRFKLTDIGMEMYDYLKAKEK